MIGISSIVPNFLKVRRMCRMIRKHQPRATIVVGGHIANVPDLKQWVDADHMVRGDGVRWMRRFLGEDENRPIRHPLVMADIGPRIMGVPLQCHAGLDNATLIPSVGCPLGCNFCSTSAMFGGKGKFVEFYKTGDELFEIMCVLESNLGVRGFFVMDENFLFDKRRALRLLELMEEHGKAWFLKIFSSANVLRRYTMEQLVALGVAWVWMGLEGKDSQYAKLAGTDTRALVRELQAHGIRVLGSSIIGLEEHTPENIDPAIDHAVAHETDLHQFMLYTPIPGTPLFDEHEARGTLLAPTEFSVADIHGQLKFNFRHPHIAPGEESEFLLRAFQRDFEVNGPSVVRMTRTLLRGWQRYKQHPNPRIRARFAHEAVNLPVKFAGRPVGGAAALPARSASAGAHLGGFGRVVRRVRLESPPGGADRGPLAVPYVCMREERRMAAGRTYEPPTFYETNSVDGPPTAVRVRGVAAEAGGRPGLVCGENECLETVAAQ